MTRANPLKTTNKPLAFTLMGPTASGKTDLALHLADQFPVELVSVDSSLVYRGMNIGSAKPDPTVLKKYPHHLIDIRNVDEPYSAADFLQDAFEVMEGVWSRDRIPLLVGGTMLYFKVLSAGIAELPTADAGIRAALVEQAEKSGWPAIHELLQQVDPVSAQRIHPNDSQRLQRALEVFQVSGKTLTELQAKGLWGSEQNLPFKLESMALMTDNRALLHQRIETRFRHMLATGLVDEVRQLKALFPGQAHLPAMKAVGYRQVWQYLDGEFDEQDLIAKGVAATRQLAKRQITWLRSWPDVSVFDREDPDLLNKVSSHINSVLANGELAT